MGLRTWIGKKTGSGLEKHSPNKQNNQQEADSSGRTKEESFWIREGVDHIIPGTGNEFPEGFDVEAFLRQAIGSDYPVLEIGCGVGRIASLFKPDEYIGVDINPTAIQQAKQALPNHNIQVVENGQAYSNANSVLLYTVLLHISDEEIEKFLSGVCLNKNKVIFAELMDTRWRRDGNPPVFNRDPETYILLMQKLGFKLTGFDKQVYERYNESPWNIDKDTRITILIFEK